MSKILIIIPARGGSKGIPRKNLRTLAGKPLIYYSIQTALSLEKEGVDVDVYVSSEDNEILALSQQFGAQIIKRDPVLSGDLVTLDSVICEAYRKVESKAYDLVITMQPTSPLLKKQSLLQAIKKMEESPNVETVLSVTSDAHLSWKKEEGAFVPNYEKRLNRQELPNIYKETGGFVIARSFLLREGIRIGKNVDVFELNGPESIDIDDFSDWSLCEYYVKRKQILFIVAGYREIGMGHVYNALSIANEILEHEITFLVDNKSQLAFDKIASNHYKVIKQKAPTLLEEVHNLNPDIIINDRLDTDKEEILEMKKIASHLINFEDLGSGASEADLVFNAMYPERESPANHFYGLDYFILRDEFLFADRHIPRNEVKRVLVCFGGVDPNDFTRRIVSIFQVYQQIEVSVIVGLGYEHFEVLKEDYPQLTIMQNVSNISTEIAKADIVFTSAGRTTFETASIGTPAIILCQNQRETTHFFAWDEYGFKNLGLGSKVTNQAIENAIKEVFELSVREEMIQKMNSSNLRNGKTNVLQKIRNLISNEA